MAAEHEDRQHKANEVGSLSSAVLFQDRTLSGDPECGADFFPRKYDEEEGLEEKEKPQKREKREGCVTGDSRPVTRKCASSFKG